MKCENFKTYIVLSDIEKLDSNVQKAFTNHIETCENCQHDIEAMKIYHAIVNELNNSYPDIDNAEEFTNQIMDSLNKATSRKVTFINAFSQIAAAITILFIIGFYTTEKSYINKSFAEMEAKYTMTPEKIEFIKDYNQCRSSSAELLKDIITNDENLIALIESETLYLSPVNIKKYSSNLCQQSTMDFANASSEKKKQLIKQFLRNEL